MFGNTNSVEDGNVFEHFASGQSELHMLLSQPAICVLNVAEFA